MRVDRRAGSKDLIPELRWLGADVEEAMLEAGDIEIIGNGPEGPLLVGIEYKKLSDVFSCVRSGRFAEQLRGMKANYQISWLLVEGELTGVGPGAILKTGAWPKLRKADAGMTYAEFSSWIMSMALCGGVLLWRTRNKAESAAFVYGLEKWLARDWSSHGAHLAYYTPPIEDSGREPGHVERVASVLPGIGSVRARAVAKHFSSIAEMVEAAEEEWVKVEGIGATTARKLVKALRNK